MKSLDHDCTGKPKPRIKKKKLPGTTVFLEIICKTCNKKFPIWTGSSKKGDTKQLQVNLRSQVAGQLSNISYIEYFRFLADSGIKPLSKVKSF